MEVRVVEELALDPPRVVIHLLPLDARIGPDFDVVGRSAKVPDPPPAARPAGAADRPGAAGTAARRRHRPQRLNRPAIRPARVSVFSPFAETSKKRTPVATHIGTPLLADRGDARSIAGGAAGRRAAAPRARTGSRPCRPAGRRSSRAGSGIARIRWLMLSQSIGPPAPVTDAAGGRGFAGSSPRLRHRVASRPASRVLSSPGFATFSSSLSGANGDGSFFDSTTT